jgi:hypothetical protein
MEEQFKQAFAEIEILKKRVSDLESKILQPSLFERREAALSEIRRRYERQNGNMPTSFCGGYDEVDK